MNRKYKNTIIAILLACILTMAIGYSLLNQRLNVSGTSSISSEFNVKFTDIISNNNETNASDKVAPSYTDTSAIFNTNLLVPGDIMTYDITVSNLGSIDAKLLLITIDKTESAAIKIDYSGIKEGDILPAGQSIVVHVNVKYNHLITSQPDNVTSDFTFDMDFGQTDESTKNEIVNTSSYLKVIEEDREWCTSGKWSNGPLVRDEIESINFATTSVVPAEAGDNYWDISSSGDGSIMAWYVDSDSNGLYEVTIGQYNGVKANPDSSNLFYDLCSLTSLDLTNLDTSDVVNMDSMFYAVSSLPTLDISPLNTSNVTNMAGMFAYTNALTSLDVSTLNTSKVNNMNFMFEGIENLKELDVSTFDTSKVKTMRYMFFGSWNLTSLNISNFNTSNVTDMHGMFSSVDSLTSLDVSHLDTSKVTDMADMFSGAGAIESLNVSNFNTSNVTDMSGMFWSTNLDSLNLSNFDTSKVIDMSSMFGYNKKLTSLNISNFDTSKVTDTSYMFDSCNNLKTIYVSDLWKNNAITSSKSMFNGAFNIVGGNGTTYDSTKTDASMANYTTGYFTYKSNN